MLALWLAALAALPGTRVSFEHLHSGSQLSVTLVPVDPAFSPALGGWGGMHTHTHTRYTYIHASKMLTCIK